MAPEPSAPSRRPGLPATIGRYRIVERVGRGAMGVVYAAQDDEMGRPVAIKVLMGDLEHDPESRTRFYREAQAAAALLHPNIITIYDAGEDQGRSFIAMQLLEGWPLAAYVKQPESVPLERKVDLMVQVCEGLAAAHARGIVHRDLKPGNLFVQTDGLLKILDFGVARLADSRMTATGMMLGTPDYMSPEQARGAQVDTRSDIFSAGAVFYFMLAGRKPFPGPDLPAILRQLQFESPAPLPSPAVPAELARIVMHAMAKDPSDRPSRIQEVHTALVRFRRAFDAETRRLVSEVQARFAAAVDAEHEVEDAARRLELLPSYQRSAALGRLRETYAAIVEKRGAHDVLHPPDRRSAEQALEEVEREQHHLEGEARRYTGYVRSVETAEGQLTAGDARDALRSVEPVREGGVSSQRLQRLVERAEPAAAEQDRIDSDVEARAGTARAAIGEGEWDRAVAALEEALQLRPASEMLRTLLQEAAGGAARERQRRQQEADAARARAAAAIAAERFEDAAAALDEAEGVDPGAERTAQLRQQLSGAQAAAAERARIRQLGEQQVLRARGLFRRGAYRDAIDALSAFSREHPAVEPVVGEIDRLRRLYGRIEQAASVRRARSGELASAARAHAEKGELQDAIACARDAVIQDGSDDTTVALLGELIDRERAMRVRQIEQAAARIRDDVAERLVAEARTAQSRGYLGEALTLATAARTLAAEGADMDQLLDELRGAISSEDTSLGPLEETPFSPRAVPPAASPTADAGPPPARSVPAVPAEGSVIGQMQGWLRRRRPPGA